MLLVIVPEQPDANHAQHAGHDQAPVCGLAHLQWMVGIQKHSGCQSDLQNKQARLLKM
jgi:hypothetical protein